VWTPPRGRGGSGSRRAGGRALGGHGAMEAPAELLAALPALVTVLALLLAWLLVRRGAAASPGPPEPAPRAEASGTPAPLDPCATESAVASEGPEEPAGPGEPEVAPAEAEEQAAEARQVRTRAPPQPGAPWPLGGFAGPVVPPPPPPQTQGNGAPGRAEAKAGRKRGSGALRRSPTDSPSSGRKWRRAPSGLGRARFLPSSPRTAGRSRPPCSARHFAPRPPVPKSTRTWLTARSAAEFGLLLKIQYFWGLRCRKAFLSQLETRIPESM
jgi:hypothetical protein